MGQKLFPPQPVKLIVGMLATEEALFSSAEQAMQKHWGNIDIHSDIIPFTFTTYYKKEMGDNLLRKFISFQTLIDPILLAKIKHQSNALEEQFASNNLTNPADLKRPINLDPGYIEPSKLILATTKNYSHRIYIGDSMYAETTLHFSKATWQAWPFTYPDYASGAYDKFLNQTRDILLEQLSSNM